MSIKILNIAVKNWNESFSGSSALGIAKKLKLSNADIMKSMEELCKQNKGTINANVTLYEVRISIDKKTKKAKVLDPTPVQTHIFFPAKTVLQDYYKRNLKKFYKNGEYKNRLRQGFSQITLIYFDVKVLSKYLDNKEIYDLNDDITGGVIYLHTEVISKMSQEEFDEIGFDKVWYGKRLMANGGIAVSAILSDLFKLPLKEQSYWHSFEIDNPLFINYDPDFEKFIERAYKGEWVESDDPIQNIYKSIEQINANIQTPIFAHASNPYLKYPTNNTYKDFADANSELYKIIGPDNLIAKNLKTISINIFGNTKHDFVHKESQRPLSGLQIFQMMIDNINPEIASNFKLVWSKIKDNRIEGDHKITTPKQTTDNFHAVFRALCEDVAGILSKLNTELLKQKENNMGIAGNSG